jgi:hypothetical protein
MMTGPDGAAYSEYVTQDDLAASCGCTVRQVRRLVGELAAERYLAHRRRGGGGGGEHRICTCCRKRLRNLVTTHRCPVWSKSGANRTECKRRGHEQRRYSVRLMATVR